MNIDSAAAIYFSPTGTTKKTVHAILKGMGITRIRTVDITPPHTRSAAAADITEDIAIIGVPVYEEQIPALLLPYLKSLKGQGRPAVLVAVYGNIGEGTALSDLCGIAEEAGFWVAGGGAFIGAHSFSTAQRPVAQGRPDADDLAEMEDFGAKLKDKLLPLKDLNGAAARIPTGSKPLMAKILPPDSARLFTKTPSANPEVCTYCRVCASLCPTGAIDKSTMGIDEKRCLRCFCCVKRCPHNAREISYRLKFPAPQVLAAQSRVRRKAKTYL